MEGDARTGSIIVLDSHPAINVTKVAQKLLEKDLQHFLILNHSNQNFTIGVLLGFYSTPCWSGVLPD
ncbi:hypothetical protein RB195_004937 [Necator americanus]|uniref:Uncharacterized protein n=1 Tax=Necator americanus TaxID=51031 RepID=A0ABR1BKE8_NECAM